MVLDNTDVGAAYTDFLRGEPDALLALVDDEFLDNVSGQRGPGILHTVGAWLSDSFSDVEVDLHALAKADDGRVLVWVTLHGTHIGSAFPFMASRPPTGGRVAWPQVHIFRIAGDRLVEHWAVRNDLRLLEAIDEVP